MDSDSDGFVTISDIGSKLNRLGFSLNKESLTSIWDSFPKSNNSQLSLSEYLERIYSLYASGDSELLPEEDEAFWELAGTKSLPPYLQQNVQKRLKKKWDDFSQKIHWHQGSIEKMISELGEKFGPFDVIHTSNVTDWMPVSQCKEIMATCYKFLVDGGAVICRRLNGDYSLASVVSETFAVDSFLNSKLLSSDRSFFYSEVVAGRNFSEISSKLRLENF